MVRKIVISLALLTAAMVTALGIRMFAGESAAAPPVSPTARAGDLVANADTAGWIAMDHDMSSDAPGYQMPPAMMPGMPEEGEQRLAVTITVTNNGTTTRPLRAREEFVLRGNEPGQQWTAHSDSFGELPRIAQGNAIRGVLFFDLPPLTPVWLEWTHEGVVSSLALTVTPHPGHG